MPVIRIKSCFFDVWLLGGNMDVQSKGQWLIAENGRFDKEENLVPDTRIDEAVGNNSMRGTCWVEVLTDTINGGAAMKKDYEKAEILGSFYCK